MKYVIGAAYASSWTGLLFRLVRVEEDKGKMCGYLYCLKGDRRNIHLSDMKHFTLKERQRMI